MSDDDLRCHSVLPYDHDGHVLELVWMRLRRIMRPNAPRPKPSALPELPPAASSAPYGLDLLCIAETPDRLFIL